MLGRLSLPRLLDYSLYNLGREPSLLTSPSFGYYEIRISQSACASCRLELVCSHFFFYQPLLQIEKALPMVGAGKAFSVGLVPASNGRTERWKRRSYRRRDLQPASTRERSCVRWFVTRRSRVSDVCVAPSWRFARERSPRNPAALSRAMKTS